MPKLADYLRIKEAAEHLGVCRETLRNWEAAGKIAVHRHPINGYRLYKPADLERINAKIERARKLAATTKRRNRPR